MSNKKKADILINEARRLESMMTIESRIKYALHELLEKVRVRGHHSCMDPVDINKRIEEVGKRYDELDRMLDDKMEKIYKLTGKPTITYI